MADTKPFTPKLTEIQRRDIFRRALEGESVADLAAEFGVCKDTIRKIKYDNKRLDKAMQSAEAHRKHAQLRVHLAALKGVEKEHEILDREVPEGAKGTSLLYLQHQVASSMMDRDGMKAVDKKESKVEVVFGDDDIPMGMPPRADEGDDA